MINDVAINEDVNAEMKERWGGKYSSDNIYKEYNWGRFGYASGGGGVGGGGDMSEGEMDE